MLILVSIVFSRRPILPISVKVTSLALEEYHDCPNTRKVILTNTVKWSIWFNQDIFYKQNKTKDN